MKIAFFWTWEFSKNILQKIIENKNIQVKMVVSQPDKPVWRKKEIIETPVKKLAKQNQINVIQPTILRDNNSFFDELKSFDLDFIIVVAYWKIVPIEVLNSSKYWCINIHWSLLPKYRWASPIQESIKSWDKKTWITIMYMTPWMDEWDILSTKEIEIKKYDKTQDIFEKFEQIAPDLLINTLESIKKNEITPIKQNEDEASYCSKITKNDWLVDWQIESAKNIFDKFKAYNIWPWIFSYYKDKKINFEDIDYQEDDQSIINNNYKLWDVVEIEQDSWSKNKKIWVLTKKWIIILKKVKLEWKKEMDINVFINWNKEFLKYNFINKW